MSETKYVRYIGEDSSPTELITGKEYVFLGEEHGWYRVIDETEEDFLFPKRYFELIE